MIKKKDIDIPISIDTYKSQVAKQALMLGIDMINDVTAFRGDPEMIELLGDYKPYGVIMYSKDKTARTTDRKVDYTDVVSHIKRFLIERIQFAIRYGIPKDKIIIDPGLGAFISSKDDSAPSFKIINELHEFKKMGYRVLISPSQKSFLGGEKKDRFYKTLATSAICAYNGADFIRVHDIKSHRDVIDTVLKIR